MIAVEVFGMTQHQSHNPLLLIDPSERERDSSEPASPVNTTAHGIAWIGAFLALAMVVFLVVAVVAWVLA